MQDAASGFVESMASMQLAMSSSILANVTVSARGLYRTSIQVTGTEGVLLAENGFTVDRPIDLVIRRSGNLVESVEISNADGYTRMLDGFADALRGGAPFRASGRDGVRNMRALDAAYASWHTGLRINLAETF